MTIIAISGMSGLIGSSLKSFLSNIGYDVRDVKREGSLEGVEVVIHLAGSSIAKRWTKKILLEIKQSRLETTKKLVEALASLNAHPKVFISASAVGYYGDTHGVVTDESGKCGSFFLSEVCSEWEKASDVLKEKGIRVVHCRFGIVLSEKGGILKKILPLFKVGLGGRLGSGKQYMSWIAIDDVVGSIYHVMQHKEIEGAINVVSPFPVTNKVFTKILCKKLGRPIGPPVPAFLLKILFGKMAEELFLSSAQVDPRKLLETGYLFKYPDLSSALVKYLSLR